MYTSFLFTHTQLMLRWLVELVLIWLTMAIMVGIFVASPVFIARLMLGDSYFSASHGSDL